MGSFVFMALLKVLEWSFVTALVLTYIEIGPGGGSVGAVVDSFKSVLVGIDWASLSAEIIQALKTFVGAFVDSLGSAQGAPEAITDSVTAAEAAVESNEQ